MKRDVAGDPDRTKNGKKGETGQNRWNSSKIYGDPSLLGIYVVSFNTKQTWRKQSKQPAQIGQPESRFTRIYISPEIVKCILEV